jgi:hypothetical protein
MALGALGVLLAAHLLLVPFQQGLREMGTDFPNYYTAAVLTLKHQPLRQFYDWVWFQRQIHYAGIDHQLGAYVPHTPLTMFPMLPLAAFRPQRAKQIWVTLELILLAASIFLLTRLSRLGKLEIAVLALLAHTALSNNLRFGQYYILLLFLLTCSVWCLLREHQSSGGALLGLIFALKLYTAPFILYFAVRRQWKALAGFVGAMAALWLLAIAVFGWDDVWFFITTVMMRGFDGSVNDPYNPGWASMTAFLRRMFLPEAELNPYPAWQAPAAFFFLRAVYTLGILAVALVALEQCRRNREAQALGWFIATLFVLSPNAASYHFILLLVAVALWLPGESRRWSAGLILLYVLVELPLFRWDAAIFPKAWLLLALFFYTGRRFLREIGRVPLTATLVVVVGVSAVITLQRLQVYRTEAPQVSEHAIVDPAAIYSAAPVFGANGWMYESMVAARYVLRKWTTAGIQTLAFDGDAFHPAESQQGRPVFFELVEGRASRIVRFDMTTNSLQNVETGDQRSAIEPALSPDATKLAFVSDGSLYLAEDHKPSLLAAGPVSNPTFFPDGTRIAFAKGPPGRRSIAAMMISGEGMRTLVHDGDCFQPAVSPDSRLLAFARSATGERHVWVRDLSSGTSRRLTNGFCNNDSPAWEPDSQSIVFASDCSRGLGLPALYRISVPRNNAGGLLQAEE